MTRRRLEVIEEPRGQGTITSHSGEKSIPARYRLSIRQEILISETFGEVSEDPGLYRYSGRLKIAEGEPMLLGNEDGLVLTLEDDRKVGFFIERASSGSSWCEIAINDEMTILNGIAEP